MGEIYAAIALCLFSCNIILTKVASGRVPLSTGFTLSVVMNAAFSSLLVAVQTALRTDAVHWRWDGFFVFALAGIFSTYLGRFFFFESVVRFGPARASIFQVTAPIFTVLVAWLLLGERLGAAVYAGIAMSVAGLFLVVYMPGVFSAGASARKARGGWLRWAASSIVVFGLGASLCYAIGNVLRGAAMKRWDEPLIGALIAACAALCMQMITNRQSRRFVHDALAADGKGVLMYLGIGTITITAQIMVFFSIRHTAVSIATLISSVAPVLVLPMSYWFLGNQESITPRIVIGSFLTMAGIALVLLG